MKYENNDRQYPNKVSMKTDTRLNIIKDLNTIIELATKARATFANAADTPGAYDDAASLAHRISTLSATTEMQARTCVYLMLKNQETKNE